MTKIKIKCDFTGEEREVPPKKDGEPKLPRGWKRVDGKTYSAKAWKSKYVMRAVSIPLQSAGEDRWSDFCAAIHSNWKDTTRISNHLISRLYQEDVLQAPIGADGKLPKMPNLYLYPETAAIGPGISGASRSSLCQSVEACYRADRFSVRVMNNKSVRSYRYPQPLPVTEASWRLSWLDEGRKMPTPVASMRIGDETWDLKLRNDAGSRRAIGILQRDDVIPTALAVEAKKIGSHRGLPTLFLRDSGGQRVRHFVMLRISCWVPRQANQTKSGTFFVRTDQESFLIGLNAKEEKLWVLNADHIRRWVKERDRRKQRLSDDRKAEQRPIATFQSRSNAEVMRFKRRMSTACHEAAAQVVQYARRRRFLELKYNDSETGFVDHFPWFELKDKIKQKCEKFGITFTTEAASAGTAGLASNTGHDGPEKRSQDEQSDEHAIEAGNT